MTDGPIVEALARWLPAYNGFHKIASGSFGSVFICVHVQTGYGAVVKVIPKSSLEDPKVRNATLRERKILKILNHPCIVHGYEFVDTNDHLCFVQEHANGMTLLEHILMHGKLAEDSARLIFVQMASAVDYLHNGCKIVHRDLKLENIIVVNSCVVKVIDFGFANVDVGDHLFATNCGSIQYAAPELFLGQEYSTEVDIWALGVLLFAMTTGSMPFQDPKGSQTKVIEQIVQQEDIPFPADFSSELRDLIGRMLMKNQASRLTIQEVLLHPWMCGVPQIPRSTTAWRPASPGELDNSAARAIAHFYGRPPSYCEGQILSDYNSDMAIAYRIVLTEQTTAEITRSIEDRMRKGDGKKPNKALLTAASLLFGANSLIRGRRRSFVTLQVPTDIREAPALPRLMHARPMLPSFG
jgi:serine/threonine protein kinase